ncbi:MAG: Calx-beta domain-containing protein [bacterium]
MSCIMLGAAPALAVIIPSSTWNGGGADAYWSTGANWVVPAPPPPDTDAIFPAGAAQLSNIDDLAAGTAFSTITFNGAGGGYVLDGNPFGVNTALIASNTAGTNTINNDVQLGASVAFTSTVAGTDLIFEGQLDLNGKTLTVAGDGDMEFRGPVIGTGSGITKNGGGTLRLAGSNAYDGATTINAGVLFLEDSTISTSAVTLTGGALAGNGSCGSLSATGGTIIPGSSVGLITVGNGLTLGANSTLQIEVNGRADGAGFDVLDVTGPVQLGGGAFDVTFGFTPEAGDKLIIVNNDGTDAVTGEFASFPQGSPINGAGAPVVISYTGGDGNDVSLVVPTLGLDDIEVTEDEPGISVDAIFTVSLSLPSLQTISVDYATTDGTAVAPLDYASQSGTVTFAPGETTKEITIQIASDAAGEGDETFTIVLSNPANALIGQAQGTCTIHNASAPAGSSGCGCIMSSDDREAPGLAGYAWTSAVLLALALSILQRRRKAELLSVAMRTSARHPDEID